MIEKLIYDDKAEYTEPYIEYISQRFTGLEKTPVQEVPFHISFFKKIDFFIFTSLHLRIGVVARQPETEITASDFVDFDYILLDKAIKTCFEDERIIYWDSKEDLVEAIRFLENKKKREINKARKKPYCSVIVSTYNSKDLLKLTLAAYTLQSYRDFEIIVADDGSSDGTEEMVKGFDRYFPLQYCWQEDRGFRKPLILNKALAAARGKYIIMTDHDAIPGPDFVKQHIAEHQEGLLLAGGRRCIPQEHRSKLDLDQILLNIRFLDRLATLEWFYQKNLRLVSLVHNPYFYAIGVNVSCFKKHFLEVSGYREELVGYGEEDIDIAKRMYDHGLKFKGLLNSQLYHVEHPLNRNYFYMNKDGDTVKIKIKQVIEERGFWHKSCTLVWTTRKWEPGSIHKTELRYEPPVYSFFGAISLPPQADKLLFKIQYITQHNEVVWNDNNGKGWSWDLKENYIYHVMPESTEERNDWGEEGIYIPEGQNNICI